MLRRINELLLRQRLSRCATPTILLRAWCLVGVLLPLMVLTAGASDQPPKKPKEADLARIRPGLALDIQVEGVLPTYPLNGIYTVEPSGKLPLGLEYGRVSVVGLTLEEAEVAITKYLEGLKFEQVKVFVTLAGYVPSRQPTLEVRIQGLERELRELRTTLERSRGRQRE